MIASEVGKIENWKQRCRDIVGTSTEDTHSLLCALQKVCMRLLLLFSRLRLSSN